MKKFVSGALVFILFLSAVPIVAKAGAGFVTYKPGTVKAAIAKGKTTLLFFKSTY